MTAPRKPAAKKTAAKPATKSTTRRPVAKKTTSTRKTAAAKKAAAPTKRGRAGSNERATFDELLALDLVETAAGRIALEMAKWVDKATSARDAAAAGRELRMQMAVARNVGKPLSPPTAGDAPTEDDDGEETAEPKAGVPTLAAMRARRDARRTS